MALALQSAQIVRQKTFASTRSPYTQLALKMLFSYLAQHRGTPDLQLVSLAGISADVGVADAPCRLYAVFLKRSSPAAAAYVKFTDHASTASHTAPELSIRMPVLANEEEILTFGNGVPFAAGIRVVSDTTGSGSTPSNAADRPSCFALVGGA